MVVTLICYAIPHWRYASFAVPLATLPILVLLIFVVPESPTWLGSKGRIDEMEAHDIARKGIAHCPERRRLFYDMTVMENIELGAYALKDRSKYSGLLDFVFDIFPRLDERRKQRSGTLSGGEQQMLAIARSLMSNPKFLLLDEPSLGLAPKVKQRIFEAIEVIKEEGTTALLVEQDAVLAMQVADNIFVLEDGKIEMSGTREELEREPRIKKVYLGI